VQADSLGYDSIWYYDHLTALGADPTRPVFDGWTAIAALGALSSRSRLGILVTAVTLRNPGVLAKMAATLDHLCEGRAILGLGAAWHEDEHRAYGIPFPPVRERLALLDESCAVIRSLFEDDMTTFEGEHCSMHNAVLWPKPIQARLPILIGGSGERTTLRIVARHADLWNAFGTPEVVTHKLSVLHDHCAAVGRDPATIGVTLNTGVIIRDSAAGVQARLREIGEVAGFPDYAASNQPYGSPEVVAQHIAEYGKAGVSEVIAVMPAPYDDETIERLATDVRPRVNEIVSAFRPN
jgi:F420-dependent oxidoreductase-like protein